MTHDVPIPGALPRADERTRRILAAAVELAEAGGFAAVRLRDVAQVSGVALGTLYKRFHSKEGLLVGVFNQVLQEWRTRLAEQPICGPTEHARLVGFFRFVTEFLCARPNLARAVVRSAAAGEPAISERINAFHSHFFGLSFAAMHARTDERAPTPGEEMMLGTLQQVWFSALCAWAGGVFDLAMVGTQIEAAARLMRVGVQHWQAAPPIRGPVCVAVRSPAQPVGTEDAVDLVQWVGDVAAHASLGPVAWRAGQVRVIAMVGITGAMPEAVRPWFAHCDVVALVPDTDAATSWYDALNTGAALAVAAEQGIALVVDSALNLRAVSLR